MLEYHNLDLKITFPSLSYLIEKYAQKGEARLFIAPPKAGQAWYRRSEGGKVWCGGKAHD